jgi:UDP-N-acetylmuramyl tripeptide synthase
MGKVAAAGADHVVVTDDNPREEDPQQIVADILAGVPSLDRVQVVPERGAAIERAIRSAAPNDVVLIAGKGHERVQIIGGISREFSDAAVAQKLLRQPGAGAPP